MEWASDKLCRTFLDYCGHDSGASADDLHFDESVQELLDDLIVLKVVSLGDTFGIIFSSRRLMVNIRKAILGQERDGVFGATDGTYKLHFGGWTLISFGTFSTRYTRGAYSKHFVPWTIMFVRSENEASYRELFSTTRRSSQLLFGKDLVLEFGSLDHTTAIANAFEAEWPGIKILNCWPHFVRKSKEKASLLKRKNYYDDVIYPHLLWMRAAKTHDQFVGIGNVCKEKWFEDGEVDYLQWFDDYYFCAPWNIWYSGTGSGVAVVLPSQNPIEAFHCVIKKSAVSDPSSEQLYCAEHYIAQDLGFGWIGVGL